MDSITATCTAWLAHVHQCPACPEGPCPQGQRLAQAVRATMTPAEHAEVAHRGERHHRKEEPA
jgi:hypothetical protein